MKIKRFKINENKEILSPENIDFIKWCLKVNGAKKGYAYNKDKDNWLSLTDYSTYLSWEELYLIYVSKKYNL